MSVIRGRVLTTDGTAVVGVRVSVVTQPLYGFTLTREQGWLVYVLSPIRVFLFYVSKDCSIYVKRVERTPLADFECRVALLL